jgi:hypothetical protein
MLLQNQKQGRIVISTWQKQIVQAMNKTTIHQVLTHKSLAILPALVLIASAYLVVCKACIDNLIENRTLTPLNYSNITTFDLFIVENLTPLTYGYIDLSDGLPGVPVGPNDAKLFERPLGLYWGERVQVDDVNGVRYITLLVYGEKRLDKLLDKATDCLYSGYIDEKYKPRRID